MDVQGEFWFGTPTWSAQGKERKQIAAAPLVTSFLRHRMARTIPRGTKDVGSVWSACAGQTLLLQNFVALVAEAAGESWS